ncbi:hypothetical protein BCR36DRAFT_587796 [Piromyces finnis]|uniref:Uncharacterized protein n=1 Tax=Piromyces finnis TaxID=1754191 RepID=A0A1Y1UUS6_9FUNG|nr:hypothetical protein BCR36DRAFT_587796 [Piromyces finnis]|eukprot:ORX41772.1 hypothetical protein BCR36DRAFT_587796 [Piromyces finnis]
MNSNQKRRSLTFAEKFEVKFFFKAEAPREVAFSETSFTTGSESYYDDDEYWDLEDSYDEEEDYYDKHQDEDDYYTYHGYQDYETNTYDDDDYYYYDDNYGYYNNNNNNVNFSIRYEMDRLNHHYQDYEDRYEEEIRGRSYRELFSGFKKEEVSEEKASEKSTTRRLALAKLEKGLFRRQQLRDSESFSETEESEASNSNSESDPFDEPLSLTSNKDFIKDLKRANSPVTIKATFTREIPISIPLTNSSSYKVKGHEISQSFDTFNKRLPFSTDINDRFKPSSLSILDADENPFSALDDTLLSCTPLTLLNKTPLVVNLSSTTKEPVKDLLKSSSTSSSNKTKSFDVKYIPSLNSNDLVKTISSKSLLSNHHKTTQDTTSITNILSNLHNNTNSKGASHKGMKKRARSYSSPSSLQQLLPCY